MALTLYTCPEQLYWVKDNNQIILVDERQGKAFILQGAEAAIWGWLSLRYAYPKLVKFVAVLLAVSATEAEQTVRATLQKWHAQGLLEISGRKPDG
jgi:hypothetical protein